MSLAVAIENTDKEVWHGPGDNPDRIFVTEYGGVGICFGGRCVVKSMAAWVQLGGAEAPQPPSTTDRIERLEDAVHELNPGWFPDR